MWQEYIQPKSVDEALAILQSKAGAARIVAGATDLILELERGVRKGVESLPSTILLPSVRDGARGIAFIAATLASSRRNSAWVSLRETLTTGAT